MPKVKTIELTGTETAVTFPQNYPHYMMLNMGDSEVCASGNPGIVPYADGVYSVPAGAEIRISPEASGDTIWLFGSGRVQVRAEEIAAQTSFRSRGKGIYTIVATAFEPKTQITWGKLKSGAGWISLGSKYVKKL